MTKFDPLALALKDHFDKPLSDLPAGLRERVENEFPISWDSFSAAERRSVAPQLDYEADPANKKERQFWWVFSRKKELLKRKLLSGKALPRRQPPIWR